MHKIPRVLFGDTDKALFAQMSLEEGWLRGAYRKHYTTWNRWIDYRVVRWIVRPIWVLAARRGKKRLADNPVLSEVINGLR